MRWLMFCGFNFKDNKKNKDIWEVLELESTKTSRLQLFVHEHKNDADCLNDVDGDWGNRAEEIYDKDLVGLSQGGYGESGLSCEAAQDTYINTYLKTICKVTVGFIGG